MIKSKHRGRGSQRIAAIMIGAMYSAFFEPPEPRCFVQSWHFRNVAITGQTTHISMMPRSGLFMIVAPSVVQLIPNSKLSYAVVPEQLIALVQIDLVFTVEEVASEGLAAR